MGSLPWETVLYELLQCGSFPWAAVLHKLLQRGSFPCGPSTGCSPSGKDCSSMGPPRGHRFCQKKPAPVWAPLHGLQFLPGACSCVGSPWAAASFRAYPPAPVWGPPWDAGWISVPPWSFMGCRGTTCVTMVCVTMHTNMHKYVYTRMCTQKQIYYTVKKGVSQNIFSLTLILKHLKHICLVNGLISKNHS